MTAEVIDGELFVSPRPGNRHALTMKSTVRLDREKKMPIYAQEGVRHAWLVEPIMRTLEVYRSSDQRKFELVQMFVDDEVIKAEPFDAVELRLDRIWALPGSAGERAVDYGR